MMQFRDCPAWRWGAESPAPHLQICVASWWPRLWVRPRGAVQDGPAATGMESAAGLGFAHMNSDQHRLLGQQQALCQQRCLSCSPPCRAEIPQVPTRGVQKMEQTLKSR